MIFPNNVVIGVQYVVWPDLVYFSFNGRFHFQMFKKACLRGKEHFNLLILESLPTEEFLVPCRVTNLN
jgi:hypothetical protein